MLQALVMIDLVRCIGWQIYARSQVLLILFTFVFPGPMEGRQTTSDRKSTSTVCFGDELMT